MEAPDLATVKDFLRFKTTYDSLNTFAEWFFAGFARVTDTEINKEDRSEVYDVSIFHHLMARPDLILTSGSVDGYRCSVVTDPDVAGDWRLAFFVRPSLYRSLPPGPQAGPGFLPCGGLTGRISVHCDALEHLLTFHNNTKRSYV